MTSFHNKKVNRNYSVLEYQTRFVIGDNLRKQALPKNFNAAHSRKGKPKSRFMKLRK